MNIGINASYLTSKNKTGVENYACLLINALLTHDQENTYSLFSPRYIDKKFLPNTHNFHLYISPFPKGWHRFRLPLSLLQHKVDLFFDPGYTVPPFISIPTIITIHDLAFKYFPEAYSSSQISLLERAFRLTEKKASGLVFISQNTQSDYKSFYPDSHALEQVIYLGYDNDNFNIDHKKDILHLDVPYILFVGRLEKRKNLQNLIRAYVKMRHQNSDIKHKLVLAGNPGHGYDEIHTEIVNNKKYGNDIIEPGYISDRDLPHLYACADLFVYPSLYEGFGIPILEAFASKTPVAVANVSSIPEIAKEGAFYFDPLDTDNIASCLVQSIKDDKGRKERVAYGTRRVKDFTWASYAKEFLSFARKVIDENSHRT